MYDNKIYSTDIILEIILKLTFLISTTVPALVSDVEKTTLTLLIPLFLSFSATVYFLHFKKISKIFI